MTLNKTQQKKIDRIRQAAPSKSSAKPIGKPLTKSQKRKLKNGGVNNHF